MMTYFYHLNIAVYQYQQSLPFKRIGDLLLRSLEKDHHLTRKLDSFLSRKFPTTTVQIREEGRQAALLSFFDKLPRFFLWLEKTDVPDNPEKLPSTCIAYLKAIAYRRTVDLLRREKSHWSLDMPLGEDSTAAFLDGVMDDAETPWQWLETQEKREIIQNIIDDPEGTFSKIRSRKYPACTLPLLVQSLDTGTTFQEISDRLEMPLGTLTAFWYRHAQVA